MITPKNKRRHRRISYIAPVRISWEERGLASFAIAKCVDLSEEGMSIEVTQAVRPGTMIQVAAEHFKFTGSASVRRMERRGAKYLLGLQLTQAMRADKFAEIESHPRAAALIENFNKPDQKV
jgi:phospholipase/lecithinase/hemolysin